jgi:hypothetical protein
MGQTDRLSFKHNDGLGTQSGVTNGTINDQSENLPEIELSMTVSFYVPR